MADENAEWARHYHSCWGLRPALVGTKPTPVQFQGSVDRNVGRYFFINEATGLMDRKDEKFDELRTWTWFTPESRFLNTPLYATYFDHNSHSATCKGLNHVLGRMSHLLGGTDALATFKNGPFSGETILGRYWADPFPSFDEALSLVNDGERISCAFHRQWAIGAQLGVELPVIYNRRRVIGIVAGMTIELENDFKPYRDFLCKVTGRPVLAGVA